MLLMEWSVERSAENLITQIKEVNPRVDTELISKAFCFSWEAHKNQVRKSGEPFLSHPVAVALILAELQLDSITIAAGLLHDVLEDTPVDKDQLTEEFGEEIAPLVDGVTKIQKFEMKSRAQRQAETYRKMLLSMAKDIRVIIIKFADRLHNLRTLKYLKPSKIRDIAAETIDIYAPLAHRLGMAKVKWELEDLAFKHLHPDEYKKIVTKIVNSRYDREKLIDSFTIPLRHKLEQEGIEATVIGRPKHFYSIYRKMHLYNRPFEEIYDLLAIRVITNSIRDCYHVLGIVHSIWKPIQDRFKDYIGTPKLNGYQSLHTTIFGEHGNITEIQIRTWEMNHVAEDGIAAHWRYKNGEEDINSKDEHALEWLKNLIEWQKDLTDSAEFFEFFKVDLFHAEIFIFTPRGDLISLPKGATVLDFAFAVHTDLGLHCIGAKVDGKIEPINTVLKSGCTVEILHSSSKWPSIDWLQHIQTAKARSSIRRYFKNMEKHESIELGKKIIRTNYNKLHFSSQFTDHVPGMLKSLGINNLDQVYELVGKGELPISRIVHYFQTRKSRQSMPSRMVSGFVRTFVNPNFPIPVDDTENIMIRFAKCCNPIPGDSIIGFVTKGRGIAIHRSDCPHVNSFRNEEERTIAVSWDNQENGRYVVIIEIVANDSPGLLYEISKVFTNFGANVIEGSIRTENQRVHNIFKIEIRNKNQLKQIFRRIQKIKGIEKISRTKDYIYSSKK
ncbi:MAG: RelA/SpoT family protein [Chitinivibrionales bacterium]|nr:RelA/SpoT family protein [Chitinivibrionales bacterium]